MKRRKRHAGVAALVVAGGVAAGAGLAAWPPPVRANDAPMPPAETPLPTPKVSANPTRPANGSPRPAPAAPGPTPSAPCVVRATQLAAGKSHVCALALDGAVWCWGANYRGQLGDGGTTFSSAPVRVTGLPPAVAIAAGDRHTCAISSDRQVWCWGANDHGQLGKRDVAARLVQASGRSRDHASAPVLVAGVADVSKLAAGADHMVAMTHGGDVYFWGSVDPAFAPDFAVREPFKVPLPPARKIAAGGARSCAWTSAGTRCWGRDARPTVDSQAVTGTDARYTPVRLVDADKMRTIVLAGELACGLDEGGTLRCGGAGTAAPSPPSIDDAKSRKEPGLLALTKHPLLEHVVAAAGRSHACAALENGQVWCWGEDDFSQLGDGNAGYSDKPVRVDGVGSATEVAVTESSTCALTVDGQVSCWGENGYGQVGDATTEARFVPTPVRFCAESPEPVFPASPASVPVLLALQRASCAEACPVYSVRVYVDGTVLYRGDWHVRVRGGRFARLAPATLSALRQKFEKADFLGLRFECGTPDPDAANVRVFFSGGTSARLIDDNQGCKGAPKALRALENEVDRLTNTGVWVGQMDAGGPYDAEATEGAFRIDGVSAD